MTNDIDAPLPDIDDVPADGAKAKHDYDEPMTIELKRPFMFGSENITALTLNPMTGAVARSKRLEDGDIAGMLWLAGKLCGRDQIVMDKLSGSDVARVIKEATNFSVHGLVAGRMPSAE